MREIGGLGVLASQRAFVDQALGNMEWPERYPGMNPPFINIAGALADFNAGRKEPKSNRFQNRPALIDKGGLQGSLKFRTKGNTVEWGTSKDYAAVHQWGGESKQPVTEQARRGIENWLFTPVRRQVRKGREGYVKHLSHLIGKTELKTDVTPRPFLGITDQLEKDILTATKRFFDGAQR